MKVRFVMLFALLLVATVCLQGNAYRVVLIPTADLLAPGMVKAEYGFVLNEETVNPDWFSGYKLDARLPGNFEVYVQVKDSEKQPNLATDVSVQYLVMNETKTKPNVSVGVWNVNTDAMALASTGHRPRGYWVAAAKGVQIPGGVIKRPVRFTLGAGVESLQGIWGGAIIPISPFAQIAVEYDPEGIRLPKASGFTAAIGYNVTPHFRVKYANLGGDSAFGLVYTDWWSGVKETGKTLF